MCGKALAYAQCERKKCISGSLLCLVWPQSCVSHYQGFSELLEKLSVPLPVGGVKSDYEVFKISEEHSTDSF